MGRPLENLTGQTFGYLTVISHSHTTNTAYWKCQCVCGNAVLKTSGAIKNCSKLASCGCIRKPSSNLKHGMTGSKIHWRWRAMIGRCENPNNEDYPNYGGRGIKVCKRWHTFENFYVDMGDPSEPHLMLEREDNNGNYSPENCKWATPTEQANNKRNISHIEINGVSKSLADWCRFYGLPVETARSRIKRGGWDEITAITTPRLPVGTNQFSKRAQ